MRGRLTARHFEVLSVLMISGALGCLADFLFNCVVIQRVFHLTFSEGWMFIYIPLDLALTATIWSLIYDSRWRACANRGAAVFAASVVACHLLLAGHHGTRVYSMNLVPGSSYLILRSSDWPQILFVSGNHVEQHLSYRQSTEPVPVSVAVVTDYGCIRSAVVSTVDGIDVKNDERANWTWRLNPFATTSERNGPGMEDAGLPWCYHATGTKVLEDGPLAARPWDEQLRSDGT